MVSAVTIAELLVVAAQRNVAEEIDRLIERFGFEVVTVSLDGARRVARTYGRCGKGRHPASLNFGDCFAYAVAREYACPLLYVGRDFARTDIESVLPLDR